jgi:hypothetical protein
MYGADIWSSSLRKCFHPHVASPSLGPKHSPQQPLSNTLSLYSSLNARDQVSHLHKTTGKITQVNTVISFHYHQANTRASDAPLVSKATLIPPTRQTHGPHGCHNVALAACSAVYSAAVWLYSSSFLRFCFIQCKDAFSISENVVSYDTTISE